MKVAERIKSELISTPQLFNKGSKTETSKIMSTHDSERLKSVCLDAITHDLKSPLTAIKASVGGLLDDLDDEMMAGPIAGSVALLVELRDQEAPLYALSNWSAATFPFARKRFEFLQWFRSIVLSAEVHLVKPHPRIFQRFCEKVALLPEQIIYIDDLQHNVEAARRIGMYAIRFSDPATLREEFVQLGLLRSGHASNALKR